MLLLASAAAADDGHVEIGGFLSRLEAAAGGGGGGVGLARAHAHIPYVYQFRTGLDW